ncbi:MAG: hypothetical protein Ct9H90mP16_06740 [Candidatus Poseidoniales archaeon]|nr:MAG: hypothetical protein Ct9H90mP16_06740 [Candidatus Poseidoniales archaeon]
MQEKSPSLIMLRLVGGKLDNGNILIATPEGVVTAYLVHENGTYAEVWSVDTNTSVNCADLNFPMKRCLHLVQQVSLLWSQSTTWMNCIDSPSTKQLMVLLGIEMAIYG